MFFFTFPSTLIIVHVQIGARMNTTFFFTG